MSGGAKIIVHVDADLEPIVPRFLELRREDIEAIKNNLEKADFEAIRIIGHSMKGAGGGYGFDYITELGMGIENSAKESDKVEIRRLTDELIEYLENIEVVYYE